MAFTLLVISHGPLAAAGAPCAECRDCVQEAVAEIQARGWLGATFHYHDAAGEATPPGLEILGVDTGGPAEQAGLRAGDSIVRLGDTRIATLGSEEVIRRIRSLRPGDRVRLEVDRRGEPLEVELLARRMPFSAIATALGAKLITELQPSMDHQLVETPSEPRPPKH